MVKILSVATYIKQRPIHSTILTLSVVGLLAASIFLSISQDNFPITIAFMAASGLIFLVSLLPFFIKKKSTISVTPSPSNSTTTSPPKPTTTFPPKPTPPKPTTSPSPQPSPSSPIDQKKVTFEKEYFEKLKGPSSEFLEWVLLLKDTSDPKLLTTIFADGTTLLFGWAKHATLDNLENVAYKGFPMWLIANLKGKQTSQQIREFISQKSEGNDFMHFLPKNEKAQQIKFMVKSALSSLS